MAKHRTEELDGHLLDAAVAMAEGLRPVGRWYELPGGRVMPRMDWEPSCDWSQAGPLIERERITVSWAPMLELWRAGRFHSATHIDLSHKGPTPLVAAMRAFVLDKLGAEVELLDLPT